MVFKGWFIFVLMTQNYHGSLAWERAGLPDLHAYFYAKNEFFGQPPFF